MAEYFPPQMRIQIMALFSITFQQYLTLLEFSTKIHQFEFSSICGNSVVSRDYVATE